MAEAWNGFEAERRAAKEPSTKLRSFAAAATAQVLQAATIAEFGDALRVLHTDAGWSQDQLAKHFQDQSKQDRNIVGLSKTRISAACNGHQLFQTEDQVRYFVIACRAEPDLKVWVDAYHRVKKNGGRRAPGTAAPAHDEPVMPTAATPGLDSSDATATPRSLLTGPDEEVVHVLQVPITRGQIRAALTIVAALGVVASSSSTPAIRAAGLTALGFAAATAVADRATAARHLPPAS